jgi:hypothetical protein
MPVPDIRTVTGKLPEGYAAVPVSAEQAVAGAPVRLCVLVRHEADPVGGHLVQLRAVLDARVYLGCIVDAIGTVHEWVEVWVQSLEGLGESLAAYRESLTNASMEERWRRQAAAMDRLERPEVYRTGWEGLGGDAARPPVTFIDASKRQAVHPVDRETGDRWTLCTDEALLERHGLAGFRTTLHRYLYLPKLGGDSVFVPVTPGAPSPACTRPMSEVHPGSAGLVAFNPGSGLMLVRTVGPIGLAAFADVLSGGNWQGRGHGRSSVDTGLTAGPVGAAGTGGGGGTARLQAGFHGGLFLGQQGKWGRLVESFHLKLRALVDAVESVGAVAEASQRPLLNISPESFQVRLAEPGRGLPHLWSARVTVSDPGVAVALPLAGSETAYFVAPGVSEVSIYRPAGVATGAWATGTGTVRIREILAGGNGEETVLEGTLATDERIECAPNDVAWMRVPIGSGRVDLYARLEPQAAMAKGEWRFRTLAQRHGVEASKALAGAKGVPLVGTTFQVVPSLTTACDLYSLGVLAVRVLLAGEKSALAVVLDEVLSLARQAGAEYDESVDLATRIGSIFGRDARWGKALGPHLLTSDAMDPAEATDLVPSSLWWETLAALVRMFPGMGPDSVCRDWGDARPGALHLVFDRAIADLEGLLRKTRSLIVIDWNYNREIHAVIRRYQMEQTGAKGAGR